MGTWHLNGVVLPDGERRDLWIHDGVITFEPVAGAQTLTTGVWITPGLVDAHCHIGLGASGAVDHATAEAQAIIDRNSGVLLVRDAGAPADTHWIDERADLPRIIRAGRHIARPKRYIRNFAIEIDPSEMVEEVSRQAHSGDGWVKLVGDWIDREVGDLAPLWPAEIAKQAIDAVHAVGARVTAHCVAEQSVAELVAAGIDCIEHGTGMSDEVIEMMAANDVALVPTMTNLVNFPKFAAAGAERFPTYAAHMRDLHARRLDTLGRAREAGVQIYCGTDAGGTLGHGRVAQEAQMLAELGGNDFALGAIGWDARTWLGAQNLVEGAPADLVCWFVDPRQELSTLHDPALVVLRGEPVSR